jgi:adenosylcobinamide-GDP ribazoletransferase
LSGFKAAVGFLTRIPVNVGHLEHGSLARAVRWFPAVGALIGVLVGVVYLSLHDVFGSFVAASLAIFSGVAITGAFHEDGLADVADAAGASDADDRIRIMKDPRLGTYGVSALVCSLLVRVAALATMDAWTGFAFCVCAHAVARSASVGLMRASAPGTEGLGATYVRELTDNTVAIAIASGMLLGGLAAGPWVMPAGAVALLVATLMGRRARRSIGGISGDYLGATEQLVEIGVFLIGAAVATNSLIDAAWWR